MSDRKTTLVYKGVQITVDAEALAKLQAKVGMSGTTFLSDVKDKIDWTLENDDVPPADVVIDDGGEDSK